ncbi:MAG: DNA cytosine methyltransferase [Candidatus Dormibacteria bacterium]
MSAPLFQVVDFFCGCGGTSLGLQEAGGAILLGIDWDHDAGQTFQANFPDAAFLEEDISELDVEAIAPYVQESAAIPLVFSGCAPCQPFSQQNAQRGRADERSVLLEHFARFVRAYLPQVIFVENVPGIRDYGVRSPLDRFLAVLRHHGYRCQIETLDARDYGVPQRRRRLFLLASRLGRLSFPEATHGPSRLASYTTVGQTIDDLPPLKAGEQHPVIPNHATWDLSPTNLARIQGTPPDGGRLDWPAGFRLDCHSDLQGYSDVYGRLRRDRPASAMTTRCVSLSNGRFGHPSQDRAISAREAARIQTFADDFVFHGSLTSVARQIGNAVPVALARAMGLAVADHLILHAARTQDA